QLVDKQQKQQQQQLQQPQHLLQISPTVAAAAVAASAAPVSQTTSKASHRRSHSQTKFKIRKTESVQETHFDGSNTTTTPTKRAASKKRHSMRKSRSLDAEAYTLACVQSPLWATLTNARTINEILQDEY
ncbi:uncharacterized protein LOC118748314, partial [Rhagoletis pomonella]|uniref:uncharacterized protein LOC118748314 n=1 Tax=Rhagoletis pomonella TaxID=28610 RepID=UPI0017805A7D